MKSNGLRAWRRWCKRARLRMNPHHRSLYRAAIMRKKQPERRPLPPKQFTARSLVGMSTGARKRAYHRWIASFQIQDDTILFGSQYVPIGWLMAQRLRPCPGCCACGVIDPSEEYSIPWCDGSGVLPARKSK